MTMRAKVTKIGNERIHIEIPRIYYDEFKAGDIVEVIPAKRKKV